MENKKIIAVIDLGNFYLKCSIFTYDINNSLKLIGYSKKKTKGIHNSIITNVNNAIDSIRECIGGGRKKIKN